MSSFRMSVDPGKVREFAKATLSANPAYLSGPAAVVPATFLTTAQLTWADFAATAAEQESAEVPSGSSAIDFDFARVLHAEESFVFHGSPPRAGQELVVTTRLGDQYEKQGRRGGTLRFAVLVNEFRSTGGELVAEQKTTLVETGRPPVDDGGVHDVP